MEAGRSASSVAKLSECLVEGGEGGWGWSFGDSVKH